MKSPQLNYKHIVELFNQIIMKSDVPKILTDFVLYIFTKKNCSAKKKIMI
jgi:hypothetical protein